MGHQNLQDHPSHPRVPQPRTRRRRNQQLQASSMASHHRPVGTRKPRGGSSCLNRAEPQSRCARRAVPRLHRQSRRKPRRSSRERLQIWQTHLARVDRSVPPPCGRQAPVPSDALLGGDSRRDGSIPSRSPRALHRRTEASLRGNRDGRKTGGCNRPAPEHLGSSSRRPETP